MESDEVTYEVVDYDDARSIATDAASTALERQGVTESSELDYVAQKAATDALDGATDEIGKAVEDGMEEAASAAAHESVSAISQQVMAHIDAGFEKAARDGESDSEELTEVMLTDEQFSQLMDMQRGIFWQVQLDGFLVAMLIGVMVWLTIVRGR